MTNLLHDDTATKSAVISPDNGIGELACRADDSNIHKVQEGD
jgi:hypothetical protein